MNTPTTTRTPLPTDNFKQPTRTELFMDGQLEGKDTP